ncbi:MAG: phosphotransferase [Spirochaetes bacterium]|nr:phosphotransferase [Spirochaetota bacterium]
MAHILTSPEDISIAWLESMLRTTASSVAPEIKDFAISFTRASTMASIAGVDIVYDRPAEDMPASLFIKTAKLNAKGVPTGSGRKEVYFYNNLTGVIKPGTVPRCYFASFDEDTKQYTIALENISATHDNAAWPEEHYFDQCCLAIDSFAEIHAAWWDHPELERIIAKRTADDCRNGGIRARAMLSRFLDAHKNSIPKEYRDTMLRYNDVCDIVDERYLSNRNISLVHRDAHFWNFMYPKNRTGSVRIIDWDSYRIDTPTNDIAYYMAIHWYTPQRHRYEWRLLERYHEKLLAHGIKNYSFEMLIDDYKLSVLSSLFLAAAQWEMGLDETTIWRPNMQHVCEALNDLDCMEAVNRLRGTF